MARRLKNAPKLTAYMNQLKNGRRERDMLENAKVKENKQANINHQREVLQKAKDSITKTPEEHRDRLSQHLDRASKKATMTREEWRKYNWPQKPKTPERPMIARSSNEIVDAYFTKTDPNYGKDGPEEAQARYEEYLDRKNQGKTAGQLALERGKGPRKGLPDRDDYRKMRAAQRNKAQRNAAK